ncbi:MAG: hypothetical protein DMF72_02035 [Acidobacteria bacterium]|nr:MAG: hypothetical protein DMF72_02035 [Acidobacteriota bacterium]
MNRDFSELLRAFNDHKVDYLVVGAHALAAHGHVRATKDLDVWIRPEIENARRTLQALESYGAPLHDLTEKDLAVPGTVFQIGIPPLRIVILTRIDGVEFAVAWQDRLHTNFGNESAWVISLKHLIANKKASGRPQDLVDVQTIEDGLS